MSITRDTPNERVRFTEEERTEIRRRAAKALRSVSAEIRYGYLQYLQASGGNGEAPKR